MVQLRRETKVIGSCLLQDWSELRFHSMSLAMSYTYHATLYWGVYHWIESTGKDFYGFHGVVECWWEREGVDTTWHQALCYPLLRKYILIIVVHSLWSSTGLRDQGQNRRSKMTLGDSPFLLVHILYICRKFRQAWRWNWVHYGWYLYPEGLYPISKCALKPWSLFWS